jgi:hypothetical protein
MNHVPVLTRRSVLAMAPAAALAGLGGTQAAAGGPFTTPHNAAQVAFHDAMRKLWEDHVPWTRLAIVTFADSSAGFGATAARLLQNRVDIGDAIKPFYGDAAGAQLTALLQDHINTAFEILQAAKNGDSDAFAEASERWYANANDIADFLSAANPRFWPNATMRADMKTHLDQTLAEAADEPSGDYEGSVAVYEEVHHHILALADTLRASSASSRPTSIELTGVPARRH